MAHDTSMVGVAVGLWLAGLIAGGLSRHRKRRRHTWLRSDVPVNVAYARLRAEIERRRTDDAA
jgi:hypothetical protein